MSGRGVLSLVHHGLGDLVMALPALDALGRSPLGPVTALVKGELEAALLAEVRAPGIGTVVALRRRGDTAPSIIRVALVLRHAPYAGFVAMHGTGSTLEGVLARASFAAKSEMAQAIVGGGLEQRREHKVRSYWGAAVRLARTAGIVLPHEPPSTLAGSLPGAPIWRPGFSRALTLAPGSGEVERHKRWPASSFAALARLALEDGVADEVQVVGATSERALLDEIVRQVPGAVSIVVTSVRQSLQVLADGGAVVANCSGTAHLAALVGAPLVSIHGPTNPGRTGAWGDRVVVVRTDAACAPCYTPDFMSGCGTPLCMEGISPASVLEAVRVAWAGESAPPPWAPLSRRRRPDPSSLSGLALAAGRP